MTLRRRTPTVLAGSLCFLAVSAIASAQQVKLGIKPVDHPGAYFQLEMNPGTSTELSVELGNFGEHPIAAVTYAADVYTIVNGGFGAKLRGEPTSGTTRWVNYDERKFSLQARQAIQRSFVLKIPSDAGPGEHITSLVIENADPVKGEGQGSFAIDQINRQAMAILVTLPGQATYGLDFLEASHKVVLDRSVVLVEMSNIGNRRVKPTGPWVIRDEQGNEVSKGVAAMDTFYARTNGLIEFQLEALLNPGRYTVELNLRDDAGLTAKSKPLPFVVGEHSPNLTGSPTSGPGFARVTQNAGDSVDSNKALFGLTLPLIGGMVLLLVLMMFLFLLVFRKRHKEEGSPQSGVP